MASSTVRRKAPTPPMRGIAGSSPGTKSLHRNGAAFVLRLAFGFAAALGLAVVTIGASAFSAGRRRPGRGNTHEQFVDEHTPLEERFETTAPNADGEPTHVEATTHAGNPAPAEQFPLTPGQVEALDSGPTDSLSVAEGGGGGHKAGQRHRPIAWFVVALVAGAFIVAGFGIVLGSWWVFGLGLGLVVVGVIIGWAGNILADTTVDHVSSHQTH